MARRWNGNIKEHIIAKRGRGWHASKIEMMLSAVHKVLDDTGDGSARIELRSSENFMPPSLRAVAL